MKKLLPLLLVLTILPACNFNSLPSGIKNANSTVITEARPVSGFQGVKVANNIALEITVGADFNMSVEGDESLVKTVSTAVEEGRLVVNVSEKHSRSTKIAVKVSMPELKELEISGGSTALVTGAKGEKIRLQANNATNIRISGEVKALEAHAYGASVIDAEGLKTGTADVEALGSTKVTVSPSTSLKARTVGIATVTYTGDPKVEKSTSDTSSVKKKE
jgi:hypothetical protein